MEHSRAIRHDLQGEYADGRDALLTLYEKGKNLQSNTNTRIDWSQDLDPENPQELPDESVTIFGSDVWKRLTRQERAAVHRLRNFRSRLFTRIVPTIKDIGLWGPKIRRAYANMGILGFADIDN